MQNEKMIDEAVRLGLGRRNSDGALLVRTGKHTGRAAKCRYIVQRAEIEDQVDWGDVNRPLSTEFGRKLFARLEEKLVGANGPNGPDRMNPPVYSMKGYVGPFPIQVRSRSPWHIAFAQNMFREKPVASLLETVRDKKEIQIFHDPYGSLSELGLGESGCPTDTVIAVDLHERKVGIVGTAYAGEIKKSAFSVCNFLLPGDGVFPMHASANCLEDGTQSSVLFGLSGTGKTTLSASPSRSLVGDDEIVWSENGISNLEGGCYAKLIDLDPSKEPDIYRASNSPGSILENVGYHEETLRVDFSDRALTENTRGSYPLESLGKIFRQDREASPPKAIVFLTADAFGALPAVAQLDSYQAQYHFISGYTAKVAGTEIGIVEPKAAFSACFGAPFMPRSPSVYAALLESFARESGATVWLLNTGWTNGGYGKGPRFPIQVSRTLLEAIQSGALEKVEKTRHPIFGFQVPRSCPGVPTETLAIPEGEAVRRLADRFRENFAKFEASTDPKVLENGGPKA